jgi:hypothetical protein
MMRGRGRRFRFVVSINVRTAVSDEDAEDNCSIVSVSFAEDAEDAEDTRSIVSVSFAEDAEDAEDTRSIVSVSFARSKSVQSIVDGEKALL